MEGDYQISFSISRDEARRFLAALATDDATRDAVEKDPVGQLAERGINVSAGLLPDVVRLPSKKEIVHILYAGDSLLEETASPFGLLIIFVFGAMPVTTRRSPAGDGAG
jgi:hypothetical protein